MKHSLVVLLLGLAAITAGAQQPPITNVHTALEHLTVIELPEPITSAAIGSDAFQIERRENRVFIKPTRSGTSTNLFLWTAHGQSVYELEPAAEVTNMNMLISQVPTDIPSSVSPTQKLPDPEVQKVADMVFAKALLSTEHVDSSEIKRARNRVSVRIEEIVRAKGSIYVRYQLTNQSRSPYRVFEPSVKTVSGSQSQLSLDSLTNRQIKEALLLKLGSLKSTELSVVWSDISRQDLAPGQSATGVIAIRKTDEEPSIFQFVFTSDGNSLVVATAVL